MNSKAIATAVVATVVAGLTASAWTQEHHGRGGPQGRPDVDMGAMLIQGLQGTDGCLGVETAQTRGGKRVIFAWFEDKAATKRWYYSETHQGMIDMFVAEDAGYTDRKPLEHVADDSGPIMVVASITPSAEPQFADLELPISQIAIELYEALPGGAHVGGRFAPAAVKVAGMRDYTPPAHGEHGHDHHHGHDHSHDGHDHPH